jgi:chromosome segregation ATPase
MRTIKQVLTLAGVSIALFSLVGCGISKEEHEKAIAELDRTKAELEQANAKIADLEQSLSEGLAKIKGEVQKPEVIEKEPGKAEAGSEEMLKKLASAEQEASELRAKVESLTGENSRLQDLLEKLKVQFAELQKKFEGLKSPSQDLPADLMKK